MATAFKQVKNNAKSTVVNNVLNNTTTPLTFAVATGSGSDFSATASGSFWVTVWDNTRFFDPGDDPDMRIGLVTVRSGDNLTVTWGQFSTLVNAIPGTPAIAMLALDQHLKDIHTAINNLEASTPIDSGLVHIAGPETITGTKTFSASPIVPTPTLSTHATSKAYVDGNFVPLAGGVTIALSINFATSPTGPTPLGGSDLATKGYVDSFSVLGIPDATFISAGKVKQTLYNVFDYGAVGDGVANDATAINAAITAANAAGGGTVFFPKGTYMCNSAIVPKSFVTLRGVGRASQLKRNSNNQIISLTNAALTWFTVEDLRFSGPVNEFPIVPRRTRTVSGAGANFAIYIRGDQDPGTPGAGAISNIALRRVIVENTTELPILLAGVTGSVKVIDCYFMNNKDPGFIFNDEVIFSFNHCLYGADNGVSFSRGNKKGVVIGNTIEGCAYQGIFAAGFDIALDGALANIGPTNFTLIGNTVKNVGLNCIFLDGAPMRATVLGNTLDQGYFRGPTGSTTITSASNGQTLPQATINVASTLGFNAAGSFVLNGETISYTGITDTTYTGCTGGTSTLATGNTVSMGGTNINSVGIYIAGWPPSNYTSPTAYAEKIVIGPNEISRCGRNGIEIAGAARNISISGVQITDVGTQFAADGSTAIASNDVTSNVGILIRSAGTPSNISVRNVDVIDSRGTPYTNYGIVPFTAVPTTYIYKANNMVNCRNAYNLIEYDVNAIIMMKGAVDTSNNRVITITNNPSVTSGFLNIQAAVSGQAVALAAESFSDTNVAFAIRSRGNGTVSFRTQTNSTTAIQFRNENSVTVVNLDTSSDGGSDLGRVGINTTAPASALHVVGAGRFTDLLLTNPLPAAYGGTGVTTLTDLPLTTPKITTSIKDVNGNSILGFTAIASAVNYLGVQNAITGGNVAISALGTDSNVGLTFKSQGTGTIVFRPSTDTILAAQFRKADNSTVVVNIDTTNGRLGIGTSAPTRTLDVVGDARVQRLLGSSGSAPTNTPGAGSGTTPTVVVTGTDVAGKVVITAGTTPSANAILISLTFGTTYPNAPYVTLTPGNTAAAALAASIFIDNSTIATTGFDIKNAGVLVATTQYIWYYHVIG